MNKSEKNRESLFCPLLFHFATFSQVLNQILRLLILTLIFKEICFFYHCRNFEAKGAEEILKCDG
jgi:hypothetical protein